MDGALAGGKRMHGRMAAKWRVVRECYRGKSPFSSYGGVVGEGGGLFSSAKKVGEHGEKKKKNGESLV